MTNFYLITTFVETLIGAEVDKATSGTRQLPNQGAET
jgi:hypothetical protein